jgi:hypothetical protein
MGPGRSRSGRGVQHYVIKFVRDLRQVGVFSAGIPVSSTNKTDCHDITEILLKVALNTIKQTNKIFLTIPFFLKPQKDLNQTWQKCSLDGHIQDFCFWR